LFAENEKKLIYEVNTTEKTMGDCILVYLFPSKEKIRQQ